MEEGPLRKQGAFEFGRQRKQKKRKNMRILNIANKWYF